MIKLYEVKGIVGQAVKALYEHYGQNLDGIQQATFSELKSLKGVGDQGAKCAYAFVHEPSYELWYNQNIRPKYRRKSDIEVIEEVLGKRIASILGDNRLTSVASIKELSTEELEKLETTTVRYGPRIRRQEVKIKLRLGEARKIHDYVHLTGYEFHTRPKEAYKSHKETPEYHSRFPDELSNKVLSLILGKEVEDWKKTIEDLDVFREVVYFDRSVLYYNQTQKPDDVTRKLPSILLNLIDFYGTIFDPKGEEENKCYERLKEDIMSNQGYKDLLDEFKANPEILGL